MSTRRVILDNTDPTIKFDGAWVLSRDMWGNGGLPLFSTLHQLNTTTGSFFFEYEGSSGTISGTNTVRNTSSSDLRWTCSVDGVQVPVVYTDAGITHQTFCEWNVDEGKHIVTFNITRDPETRSGAPFLLDYVTYTSLTPRSHLVQWVYPNDTDAHFDGDWTMINNTVMSTRSGGSTLTFPFNGTGIQLRGEVILEPFRDSDASATYTLDGGKPVSFDIKPSSPLTNKTNERLFEIPSISSGPHTISVTYAGNATTIPLAVTGFVVHNEAAKATTPSSPTPSSRPSNTAPSSNPIPIGAIVGLVVGLVVLLISLFILWRYYLSGLIRPGSRGNSNSSGSGPAIEPFSASRTDSLDTLPSSKSGIQRRRSRNIENPSLYGLTTLPPTKLEREFGASEPPVPSVPPSGYNDNHEGPVTQEFRHEDSGLRIVDGVVTLPEPPTYKGGGPPGS